MDGTLHSDRQATGTASLLSDVVSGIGRLVQGELAFARAEATESVRVAAGGLAKLAVAAVLGLVGLNLLAGAAVAALVAAGLGPIWSPLVVGLGFCAVAAGLAWAGRAAMRVRLPRKVLRNIDRDLDAIKAAVSEGGRHV